MKKLLVYFLVLFACLAPQLLQANAHGYYTQQQKNSLAMSLAFDAQGVLWRASVRDGFVIVDQSNDLGKTFSSPAKVNSVAQRIDVEGVGQPKISISQEGNIYVIWIEMFEKSFSGYIWFARSIDAGKTFEKPYLVHQNSAVIPRRLDALNLAQNGNITVLWVSNLSLMEAKASGKQYNGAAIYYAISTNKGMSFISEQKMADSHCERCRIVATNKPDSTVVVMWRNMFEGKGQDYLVAEILKTVEKPEPHRATFAHWRFDGYQSYCASLVSGGGNKDWWGYHMAYLDGNDDKSSLYYSRMDGEVWVSSPPKRFGHHKNQVAHPALLSLGSKVWLVWLETEIKNGSRQTYIIGVLSADGGISWDDAKVLATGLGEDVYPQLLANNNQAYLFWNIGKENLQVISW